jgi:ABC-type sugar transport system permease subunit
VETYTKRQTVKPLMAVKRERLAFLLTLPALLAIFLLVLYPLGYSFYRSFQGMDASFSVEHYATILADKTFWKVAWNTVKFTVVMVAIEVVLGLSVALCLQRVNSWLRNVLRAFFMIPLLIAPVVASYEWMWLFNDQYGLVTTAIKALGMESPLWLADPKWAFVSVVIVDLWIATPFVILVFQSALSSLPADPYEAAKVEGANQFQTFFYLTLPFLRPVFLIVLIIRTMDAFRLYDSIAVLTSGGPGLATTTLSVLIFKTGINFGQIEEASAMSILTVIPILIITLIYIRLLRLNR